MFQVTETVTPTGFRVIKLDEGEYSGVEYVYARVGVQENGDSATLQFEYQVLSGQHLIRNERDFKQTIGDILVTLLSSSVESGNIVFMGGK